MELSTNNQIINLDIEKSPNSVSILLILCLFLLILAGVGFGAGYLYGQIQSNLPSTVLESGSKVTSQKDGSQLFTDSTNGYQIVFTKDFKLTTRKSNVDGIVITGKDSSLELWLTVDQPVSFSTEQKAAIQTTNFKDLDIGGIKAKLTEYIYQAGNYFSVVKLASQAGKPQVTFWLKAQDETGYKQILAFVQSFKFT